MDLNLRQVRFLWEFSPDQRSTTFAGGEDGQVRIWARSGMLRSNLVQSGKLLCMVSLHFASTGECLATPIFSICWSADNDAILYGAGKHLVMKPLSPNSKQNSVRLTRSREVLVVIVVVFLSGKHMTKSFSNVTGIQWTIWLSQAAKIVDTK